MGTESRRDVETANRGLAQQEFIVRRESFRSIDQLDDITLFQRRDPRDGVLRQRHEARPVLWQESVVEVRCDAGKTPRRRIALIATHHQAAGIAAEIDEQVGVAHGGQILGDRFGNTGDQVLMRHRDEWQGEPGHGGNFQCVDPAGVHDHVRLDCTLIGRNFADAALCDLETGDPDALADAGSAASGAFRQREGQSARIEVAVGRKEGRADHAIDRHQRKAPLGFRGAHQLERQTEARTPSGLSRP